MRIKLDTTDKISEVFSALFFLAGIILVAASIPQLPDIIPCHFKFSGEPDNYGSKHLLWIGALLPLPMYIGFTILAFNPQFYRYRMDERLDMDLQYKLTSKMARSMKLLFSVFLFVIVWFMVQSAELKYTSYIKLLALFIPLIFGVIIYWLMKWRKVVK